MDTLKKEETYSTPTVKCIGIKSRAIICTSPGGDSEPGGNEIPQDVDI